MATAKAYTDSDQDNFFRMSILIVDYALKVVHDVLQKELRKKYPNLFDPNTGVLNKVLGDGTVKTVLFRLSPKVFNHHQQKQLYPAGNPSTSVTVGDLDLTLTVLLLRNITSLNPRPRLNAWDNPSDTDTSTEAAIGRVKRYRNSVYAHANRAAIDDQEFGTKFSGLKSNLLALSSKYTNEEYDEILSKPLDDALLKKYQDIMEEWCRYDKDVKDTMEAGFEKISEKLTEGITQVLDGQIDKDVKDTMEAGFEKISEKITEGITNVLEGQSELKKLPFDHDRNVQTSKGSEWQPFHHAHVPERKHSKLTTLGKIFKPWTWKRKRKANENTTLASNKPPNKPSPAVSQVEDSQHLNLPSSTEEDISQTTCTESTATSVDVRPSTGTKFQTTKPDTCYQAPAMSPTHKNLLVKMKPMLVENLRVNDIIPDMVAKNILSKDDAEKVIAQYTMEDQANELLSILPKCGIRAFETFVEVLRKHNKRELADLLAKNAIACSSKNQIATFYIKYMSQIQRLPWDPDDTMHLDDVYVNLQWVQEERKPADTCSVPIQSYTSIFKDTKQVMTPKRILVRGKAGIGKTTFTQKMATDWANATLGLGECDEVLLEFKHLLIVNLRSIQPGQTLKGALEIQITCSAENKKAVGDEVLQALDYDGDHVLLVFDGYDEYDISTSKEITDIIYRRRYQDVCTVITTRPWKAEELTSRRIIDSVYEITGLTEENIAEYVAKFFNDKQAFDEYLRLAYRSYSKSQVALGLIGNGLVGYIQEKKLMSLVKIPILLLFICLMWEQDRGSDAETKSLPASYTLLYNKLTQLFFRRRYNITTQGEMEEPIRKFEQSFISLGKLAYDGLVRPDRGLIFNENDLQTIPHIRELYSLGLLSKCKVHSNLDVKHEVTFPHKTIQEFFAAKYLAGTLNENDSHVIDQLLDNFDTLNKLYGMTFVLCFLCGLSRRATVIVLRRAKQYFRANSGHHHFVSRHSQWCNDLLLEHWYAHCPQETVLSPELVSCLTAICIPQSIQHSDPRFQQVLYDTVESAFSRPQKYAGMLRGSNVVSVNDSLHAERCETEHKLLFLLITCDMFEELLEVIWGSESNKCDVCRCALNHVLSKAPNLQTVKIENKCKCSGALASISKPGKLLHLTAFNINGQDCQVIQQMQHLEVIVIMISRYPCHQLARLPHISHHLTHIEIGCTPLGAVGVQLLGRDLHHVPGLKYLKLFVVFTQRTKQGQQCGPSRCTCPKGEDTTEYDRCQDVRRAVRELSQGVRNTNKLRYFTFSNNHLGQCHGITSPLIALIQSLSTVSEQTGMEIDMSDNGLSRVDRLSELIDVIVSSYQCVSSWKLSLNDLEKSLPQPDDSVKCKVSLMPWWDDMSNFF